MPTTVRSRSKINLGLAIGPPRADGYHALTTCYQIMDAHDLVTVEAQTSSQSCIRIASNDTRVPLDESNTAWKIVDLALHAWSLSAEVRIRIDKRLPIQGGLGAGSANAVAALLGLERELQRQGISAMPLPEKLRIASQVGSDVPLFLIGGAVLGVGHGEEVYPLPDFAPRECVLALPNVGVSTPQAFRDWDRRHSLALPDPELTAPMASGKLTPLSRALASAFCPGSTYSSGVSAERRDRAEKSEPPPHSGISDSDPLLALVRTGIENDFEDIVFRQHPSLGIIKRILAESTVPEDRALYAALSGSGSALFGLYGTSAAAAAAERRLQVAGIRTLRTKTLPRDEYWRTIFAD